MHDTAALQGIIHSFAAPEHLAPPVSDALSLAHMPPGGVLFANAPAEAAKAITSRAATSPVVSAARKGTWRTVAAAGVAIVDHAPLIVALGIMDGYNGPHQLHVRLACPAYHLG
jgi:hypothetical protein